MAKAVFWKTDWFIGVVLTLLVVLASTSSVLGDIERKIYDLSFQLSGRVPSNRVAIIAIDEKSLKRLGVEAWLPGTHARLTDLLAAAPAKLIVNTINFSRPVDVDVEYFRRLTGLVEQAKAEGDSSPFIERINRMLGEAELQFDGERQLAESYAKAGNVLLPMWQDTTAGVIRRPDSSSAAFLTHNRLPLIAEAWRGGFLLDRALLPSELLGNRAAGVGYLAVSSALHDSERNEPLLVRYREQFYPSLALLAVARSLDLGVADVKQEGGRELWLGKLRIPTDQTMVVTPFIYRSHGGVPAFSVDALSDVLSGSIPASKFAGKIVLIGAVPAETTTAPVGRLAGSVSSLLQGDVVVVPVWGGWLSLAIALLLGVYLSLLLPKLSIVIGALSSCGIVLLLLGMSLSLMLVGGRCVPIVGPLILLLLGHGVLLGKKLFARCRQSEQADAAADERSRKSGLAFQEKGQLDLAFEQFRKVPLDLALMENLYQIALDYERRRLFSDAQAVYRYMADFQLEFRDLKQRLAGGSGADPSELADRRAEPLTMLGRYRLEKQLGKGAMGVVYLGLDPQINRIVAIKTMDLAQEFESDELADVKQRFFREAETAGRLNHPNIVTMYDAGEEQDLAYIAMEFLKGSDLVAQTKPDGLLPLRLVMSIVARVADALDYAHQNQVVHRDIKPANIMYEPVSDLVKVTDFGIARITDSSRTRTGMVLGTPSYMSPEQLAGKKIDGRSDLFSLSVMLYQMSCGQLPFVGESLAQLMYKIANEPASDILAIKPGLPPCLLALIEKGLAKNVTQRFQRGSEMAAALRACLEALIASESVGEVPR